eukprot:5678074-Prymnesium_polylepis.2
MEAARILFEAGQPMRLATLCSKLYSKVPGSKGEVDAAGGASRWFEQQSGTFRCDFDVNPGLEEVNLITSDKVITELLADVTTTQSSLILLFQLHQRFGSAPWPTDRAVLEAGEPKVTAKQLHRLWRGNFVNVMNGTNLAWSMASINETLEAADMVLPHAALLQPEMGAHYLCSCCKVKVIGNLAMHLRGRRHMEQVQNLCSSIGDVAHLSKKRPVQPEIQGSDSTRKRQRATPSQHRSLLLDATEPRLEE